MAKAKRVIFHLDMDAFFASCLEVKNPHLKQSPVVVGYNSKHAIVVTANYLAREYGIKTAMPLHKAKALCPNLVVAEPDYQLFSLTSKNIWTLIEKQFSSKLEILSIDECFLDVTEIWKKYQTPVKMALKIQQVIKAELGLTLSVGISYNKFLAKMATDMQKPNGITRIGPTMLAEKLWPLPIEKMYGVGIASGKVLKEKFAVKTIGDLVNIDPLALEKQLGKTGLLLLNHALGYGDDFVNPQRNLSKSISNEITLSQGINNPQELEELLLTLTKNNLIRLKRQDLLAKTVSVYVRYQRSNYDEDFDKLKHLKHQSKQLSLQTFTNEFEVLFATVKECFDILYQTGRVVNLIGVAFNKLKVNDHFKQISFDDPAILEKQVEINNLIWEINQHLKKKKIGYANQLINQEFKYSKHFGDFIHHDELRKKK